MNTLAVFLAMPSPWQIIVIVAVILLLFGGKKIPELMRGLGKGVKSFKDGLNEAKEEINKFLSVFNYCYNKLTLKD